MVNLPVKTGVVMVQGPDEPGWQPAIFHLHSKRLKQPLFDYGAGFYLADEITAWREVTDVDRKRYNWIATEERKHDRC